MNQTNIFSHQRTAKIKSTYVESYMHMSKDEKCKKLYIMTRIIEIAYAYVYLWTSELRWNSYTKLIVISLLNFDLINLFDVMYRGWMNLVAYPL